MDDITRRKKRKAVSKSRSSKRRGTLQKAERGCTRSSCFHSMALALPPRGVRVAVARATAGGPRSFRRWNLGLCGQTVRSPRRANPSRVLHGKASGDGSPPPFKEQCSKEGVDAKQGLERVISHSGRTTDMAHALWRAVAVKGDLAIDATCGNGFDTVVLADLVLGDDGESIAAPGKVIAFDVQQSALAATRARIRDKFGPSKSSRVQLVLGSHAGLGEYVRGDGKGAGDGFDSAGDADADANGSQVWDEKDDSDAHGAVAIVCFNLGYLPGQGSDKSVVTQTESTLTAVAAAVKALRPGGVLTVVGTYFPFTTFRRLIDCPYETDFLFYRIRVHRTRGGVGGNARGRGFCRVPGPEKVRSHHARRAEPSELPAAHRGAPENRNETAMIDVETVRSLAYVFVSRVHGCFPARPVT